ncbi:MAG: 2-C-methyl-D-erythritol 4-phosphate cytidylyltransferase [Lachnospiraceae bacterium]|nr:2-C-methyl-D-erythritol 4-phosphate cytidylyltransferase [Candidatus Colinaster equi]
MTTAIILAAGTDRRFGMDIPKQFVNVNNRPLVVYTLERFEHHEQIDEIIVACLDGWQELVRAYATQFGISKLKNIITGGRNAQESTHKVLQFMKDTHDVNDIVVIHDSIRPLVTDEIITRSIDECKKNGMGVAATNVMDNIMRSDNKHDGNVSIDRDEIMKIQTPQTFRYGYISDIHERAVREGIVGFWDNSSLLTNLGEKVHFSEGSGRNHKINTVDDLELFKVIYKMTQEE